MACAGTDGSGLHHANDFILLTCSLVLIATGSVLMGFYRVHMLEVVATEFMTVPCIMLVGGLFSLLTSLFGFYAIARWRSCPVVAYAVLLTFNLILTLSGIIASILLLFNIQTGLLDADVIPELSSYETSSWVRHKWDTIQSNCYTHVF